MRHRCSRITPQSTHPFQEGGESGLHPFGGGVVERPVPQRLGKVTLTHVSPVLVRIYVALSVAKRSSTPVARVTQRRRGRVRPRSLHFGHGSVSYTHLTLLTIL